MSKPLNPKQKLFVKEYLASKNATQAAIAAGYSKKTARFIGAENLTKPNVAAAIQKGLEAELKHVEKKIENSWVTKDRWLDEVASVAFASITDVLSTGENERLKVNVEQIKKLGFGRLIKKIKVHANGNAEIELHPKLQALEVVAKHFGWIADKLNLRDDPAPADQLTEEDFQNVFETEESAALALKLAESLCKPKKMGDKNE